MLTLKKVAITGGLACGKSSVCHFFQKLGAFVVSADDIVHQLLSPNTLIGQQIVGFLGNEIIKNDAFDRGLIAKKVFNDNNLLTKLEDILHPAVLIEIEKKYQEVKNQGNTTLFIAEIPLLFEIGAETHFDVTISIDADQEVCIERFQSTTGHDREEYFKRMSRQLPIQEKNKRADYVISNRRSLEEMEKTIFNLYNLLT